jgi:hypothetical protein
VSDPKRPEWDGFEIISSYTRAEAIADGTLVDVSETAREAGFKFPMAVTSGVWATAIEPDERDRQLGQSETGRLWDILQVLRATGRNAGERHKFKVLVAKGVRRELVDLVAVVGPGDTPEPVITVMLPGED